MRQRGHRVHLRRRQRGRIAGFACFLFGWTAVLAACYYMEKRFDYLVGDKESLPTIRKVWMIVFLASISMGYRFNTGDLWIFNDLVQITGVTSSLIVLFMLRKTVVENNDFYKRYLPELEAGKNPKPVSYSARP